MDAINALHMSRGDIGEELPEDICEEENELEEDLEFREHVEEDEAGDGDEHVQELRNALKASLGVPIDDIDEENRRIQEELMEMEEALLKEYAAPSERVVEFTIEPKMSQKERKRLAKLEKQNKGGASSTQQEANAAEQERNKESLAAEFAAEKEKLADMAKEADRERQTGGEKVAPANQAAAAAAARETSLHDKSYEMRTLYRNTGGLETLVQGRISEQQLLRKKYGCHVRFGYYTTTKSNRARWIATNNVVLLTLGSTSTTAFELEIGIPKNYPRQGKPRVKRIECFETNASNAVRDALLDYLRAPPTFCLVPMCELAEKTLNEYIEYREKRMKEDEEHQMKVVRSKLKASADVPRDVGVDLSEGDEDAGEQEAEEDEEEEEEMNSVPAHAQMTVYKVKNAPMLVNHGAVALGNRVFTFGGDHLTKNDIGDIHCLDLMTRRWAKVETFGERIPSLSNPGMVGIASGFLVLGGTRHLSRGPVVRAGPTFENRLNRTVYTFNASSNTIGTESDPHANFQAFPTNCTLTRVEDYLVVVGGTEEYGGLGLDSVIVIKLGHADEIETMAKMTPMFMPSIYGHAACTISGKVLIFGGIVDGMRSNKLFLYDPTDNEWANLTISGGFEPVPRVGHTLTRVKNLVYVVGGRTLGDAYVEEIDVFDVKSQRWASQTVSGAWFKGVHGHVTVNTASKLYIIGGAFANKEKSYTRQLGRWQNPTQFQTIEPNTKLMVIDIAPERSQTLNDTLALSTSLATHLLTHLETGEYADISIELDGNAFQLHKIILLARCRSLLELARTGGSVSMSENCTKDKAVREKAWRVTLKYIYSNDLDLFGAMSVDLFNCFSEIFEMLSLDSLSKWFASSTSNPQWKDWRKSPPAGHAPSIGVAIQRALCTNVTPVDTYADMRFIVMSPQTDAMDDVPTPMSTTSSATPTPTEAASSHTFGAHKLFVTRFPYFEMLLSSGMREAQLGEIEVSECDSRLFPLVLSFMYTDRLRLTDPQDALELLAVANRYELNTMKAVLERLVEEFYDFSDVNSVLNLVELSEALQCKGLLEVCKFRLLSDYKKSYIQEALVKFECSESVIDLVTSWLPK